MIAPVSGHARLRTWIAAVSRVVAWWPWLGLALIGCGCARGSHEPVRPDANASSSAWWMFDGHVDVTVHYARAGWRLDAYDLAAATRGQTTLDRLAHGRVGGGFFTCGSPSDAAPRWPGLAACLAAGVLLLVTGALDKGMAAMLCAAPVLALLAMAGGWLGEKWQGDKP